MGWIEWLGCKLKCEMPPSLLISDLYHLDVYPTFSRFECSRDAERLLTARLPESLCIEDTQVSTQRGALLESQDQRFSTVSLKFFCPS